MTSTYPLLRLTHTPVTLMSHACDVHPFRLSPILAGNFTLRPFMALTAFLVWWETQSNLDNLTTIFDLADLALSIASRSIICAWSDLVAVQPLTQPFWGHSDCFFWSGWSGCYQLLSSYRIQKVGRVAYMHIPGYRRAAVPPETACSLLTAMSGPQLMAWKPLRDWISQCTLV